MQIGLRRTISILLLVLVCVSLPCVSAQHKRRTATKPKTPSPATKPETLIGCGVSLRLPPGWELSVAKKREIKEAQTTPAAVPEASSEAADQPVKSGRDEEPKTSPNATAAVAAPAVEMPPCSFVLAPKAPSAIVKNTDVEGPIGEMELRVVDGTLDIAAANIFQKDEKGWYAQDSKGARYDAKLTKQKTMQILTAVIVQRCYDKSGKPRGLCETSKYVYSNNKKNLLVTAGPYLGETESSVLNSVRFVGSTGASSARKRR